MKLQLLKLVLSLAALSLGSGCSFETELPEVRITQHNLKVNGVPADYSAPEVALPIRFALTGQATSWAQKMNSDVRLHQIKITPSTAHPTALDFITFLRLTLTEEGSNESVEVINYTRGEGESGSSIQSTLSAPLDITAAWKTKKSVMDIVLAGPLPTTDWSFDVTLTLSGKMTELP